MDSRRGHRARTANAAVGPEDCDRGMTAYEDSPMIASLARTVTQLTAARERFTFTLLRSVRERDASIRADDGRGRCANKHSPTKHRLTILWDLIAAIFFLPELRPIHPDRLGTFHEGFMTNFIGFDIPAAYRSHQ